jgi:hypothetical protein
VVAVKATFPLASHVCPATGWLNYFDGIWGRGVPVDRAHRAPPVPTPATAAESPQWPARWADPHAADTDRGPRCPVIVWLLAGRNARALPAAKCVRRGCCWRARACSCRQRHLASLRSSPVPSSFRPLRWLDPTTSFGGPAGRNIRGCFSPWLRLATVLALHRGAARRGSGQPHPCGASGDKVAARGRIAATCSVQARTPQASSRQRQIRLRAVLAAPTSPSSGQRPTFHGEEPHYLSGPRHSAGLTGW